MFGYMFPSRADYLSKLLLASVGIASCGILGSRDTSVYFDFEKVFLQNGRIQMCGDRTAASGRHALSDSSSRTDVIDTASSRLTHYLSQTLPLSHSSRKSCPITFPHNFLSKLWAEATMGAFQNTVYGRPRPFVAAARNNGPSVRLSERSHLFGRFKIMSSVGGKRRPQCKMR
ncbi:hypothetical protein J6590_021174 [Homalodisca vitripennis]|nr:hypothetical protein J6590_021174 [Homalodisca vitripennis]